MVRRFPLYFPTVSAVSILSPTAPEALIDAHERPYFLWDCDLTPAQLNERLRDPNPDVRAYFLAKLMRQAKPDDVFSLSRWDSPPVVAAPGSLYYAHSRTLPVAPRSQ